MENVNVHQNEMKKKMEGMNVAWCVDTRRSRRKWTPAQDDIVAVVVGSKVVTSLQKKTTTELFLSSIYK